MFRVAALFRFSGGDAIQRRQVLIEDDPFAPDEQNDVLYSL